MSVDDLIREGPVQSRMGIPGLKCKVPALLDFGPFRPGNGEDYRLRLSARPDDEVVLQAFPAAVVHEVHVLVDRRVTNFTENANVGAPFPGIAADEVVPLGGQRFLGQRRACVI